MSSSTSTSTPRTWPNTCRRVTPACEAWTSGRPVSPVTALPAARCPAPRATHSALSPPALARLWVRASSAPTGDPGESRASSPSPSPHARLHLQGTPSARGLGLSRGLRSVASMRRPSQASRPCAPREAMPNPPHRTGHRGRAGDAEGRFRTRLSPSRNAPGTRYPESRITRLGEIRPCQPAATPRA